MTRYLLEITVMDPETMATEVLRLTERSSFTARPDGDVPGVWYQPWAKRLVNYDTDLVSGGAVGEALINNASRWLDAYMGWAWREARILEGPLDRFAAMEDFRPILAASVAGRDYVGTEISVKFRDARTAWDQAVPRTAYAGTNDGPAGLDGSASLAGTDKPLVIGAGRHFPVQWANEALLIAQWNDGPGVASAVFVGGMEIPISDRVSAGDIEDPALVVAAGTCVVDDSRALIRFGSAVMRPVTVHGDTTTDGSAFASVEQLAALLGFEGDIGLSGGGFGWAFGSSDTGRTMLDAIAQANGAWWWVDSVGGLRAAPKPTLETFAPYTLVSGDIAAMDIVSDDAWAVPAFRVEVNYQRNWTVLGDDEIDPSLSDAARAALQRDWHNDDVGPVVVEDGAIRDTWPDAEVLSIASPAGTRAEAAEVAGRLFSLRRQPRYRYMATVPSQLTNWMGGAPIAVTSLLPGRTMRVPVGGAYRQFVFTGASTEDGRIFKLRLIA